MAGEIEITKNRENVTVYQSDTALKGTFTTLRDEMAFTDGKRLKDGVLPEERLFDRKSAFSLSDIFCTHTQMYKDPSLSATELNQKRRDMLSEIFGFEILRYKNSPEEMQRIKDEAKENRVTRARELDVPKSLYTTSNEQKLRVLKSPKMDEITRKNVITEEKSMDEIIRTYVTKEEQIKAAKEGKNFLKIFRNAKEEMNNNPLLTAEEKANRLYRLAKPYETAIVMYKEEYFSTLDTSNRQREIEELLDRITTFYNVYSGNGTAQEKAEIQRRMEITEIPDNKKALLTNIRKRTHEIDRSEEKTRDNTQDESLNAEQIAGIEAVDRYIIEQSNTSGENRAFVDQILRLPMRDRLIIYGLIENKREATPSAVDIAYTQIGYVPNPTIFASRMSWVPNFLWKGNKRKGVARMLTNMRWEKLEAAMEFLGQEPVQEVRNAFASLSESVDKKAIDTREEAENLEDSSDPMALLTDIEVKRDQQLLKTIKALEECRDAMVEAENSVFRKKSKAEKATELQTAAKAEIEALESIDRALYDTMNSVRESVEGREVNDEPQLEEEMEGKLDKTIRKGPPGESAAQQILKKSIFVGSQSSLILAKLDKMVTLHTGEAASPLVSAASGAFTSVTGVIGLIGGCLGAVSLIGKLKKKGANFAKTDIANMITKSTRSLGASAWGIAAGGYQIGLVIAGNQAAKQLAKGAVETAKAMKDNIGIATDAVTYATIAVSGIKAAIDVGDAVVQAKHLTHHIVASYRVHELKNMNNALKGDDAAYAKNILKIDRRNKRGEALETLNSFCVNSGLIAATLVGGPLASVAYAGAAVFDAVAMKAFMKVKKMIDLSSMVDEFLQVDDMTKQAFPEYSKLDILKKSRAKSRIRQEMMAELGYTTTAAFSKHIAKNYAEFIYKKLFFVNDDPQRPLVNKNNKDHTLTNISMACYQMVKSLGLRVKFPENKDDDDRYPTPDMIAAKLLG
ncbi:MAG: hypothetical protein IKN79_08595 [Eubacterium sp.]|nr:hypothetical protein [Eubacterium sp.]